MPGRFHRAWIIYQTAPLTRAGDGGTSGNKKKRGRNEKMRLRCRRRIVGQMGALRWVPTSVHLTASPLRSALAATLAMWWPPARPARVSLPLVFILFFSFRNTYIIYKLYLFMY